MPLRQTTRPPSTILNNHLSASTTRRSLCAFRGPSSKWFDGLASLSDAGMARSIRRSVHTHRRRSDDASDGIRDLPVFCRTIAASVEKWPGEIRLSELEPQALQLKRHSCALYGGSEATMMTVWRQELPLIRTADPAPRIQPSLPATVSRHAGCRAHPRSDFLGIPHQALGFYRRRGGDCI